MRDILNSSGKMTSVVIAEISGKDHGHLMRDIRKMEETWVNIGQSKFGLTSYIDKQNRAMPMYELSKTECLYIATKFNDEARAKLVLRWQQLEEEKITVQKPLSTLDMLEMSIRSIRANEQQLQEVKLEIEELKAKATTRPEYYTIAGYGSLNGISVNIKIASKLGREASKLCKDKGLMTDECPDPRFGKVKMYPKQVLHEVFETVTL